MRAEGLPDELLQLDRGRYEIAKKPHCLRRISIRSRWPSGAPEAIEKPWRDRVVYVLRLLRHSEAESPAVMVVPLIVLAVGALASGYVANPIADVAGIPAHWLVEYLGGHVLMASIPLAVASTVVAVGGIGLAAAMYQTGSISPETVGRRLRPFRELAFRKYYMDELYEGLVVTRSFYKGVARFTDWVDREVVDRVVDGIGWFGRNTGHSIARFQTGQVQAYGMAISLGILVILVVYLVFG